MCKIGSPLLSFLLCSLCTPLQELDFETYIDKFDMSAFRQNDIYPDIWEYEEADKIKDDLRSSFESLKKFYEKMAEQERAVLVSIY